MKRIGLTSLILISLVAGPWQARPAHAQGVQVFVDGDAVFFDQPPVITGGRVLVPLRGVFERLGAFVQWNPGTNVVTALRGDTEVRLTIGSRQAFVNARPVMLDVPPTVIAGRTLVPLRFVSEAMGARVDWNAATNTVVIFSPMAAAPVPPPPVVPPPPPPVAPAPIREVTGRIDAITARVVVLTDGRTFQLADGARFFVDGQEVAREQIQPGMQATLQIHPQANLVIAIAARGLVSRPPMPVPEVRIASFEHDAQRPLRAGAVLEATLTGTPRGVATFDIFGVVSAVPMQEVSPGVYRGRYTVRPQDNVASAVVLGRLRVGNREAQAVQAEVPVTMDSLPPRIVQRFPAPNQTVANARPNIVIAFDEQGSGIDQNASRLVVNGENVTRRARFSETALAYTPRAAMSGRIAVDVLLADQAGNATREQYAFWIGTVEGAAIRSVTVDAAILSSGSTLTVTMTGEPGGRASFRVDGVTGELPMTEVSGQPGVYVGSHVIRSPQTREDARVIVTLARAGRTSQAEASTRVTILATGRVPSPVITSPPPGARLGDPVVVRGTATPGHRVVVRVDYQGGLLVFALRGTYGEVSTTADAAGQWMVRIGQTIRLSNADLTITAVAVDPLGAESEPAVVRAVVI
jgi:hypothetical protein